MDFNQIMSAIALVIASPVVMTVVQIIKNWLQPSKEVIPILAIALGIITGVVVCFTAPNTDPAWLKWVVYIFCGGLSGLASIGIWETAKAAADKNLEKYVEDSKDP